MGSTFVMLKPDAIERGLVGEIVSRIETKGLKIKALEMKTLKLDVVTEHYGEHVGKPFFDALTTFATRGPSLLMVVEGPEDTWAIVRNLMGATDPAKAAPGTIRGDLASANPENLIHGSDSAETAEVEIRRFFPGL